MAGIACSMWSPGGLLEEVSLNWPPGMRSILCGQVAGESIRGSEGSFSEKDLSLAIQGMERRWMSCSTLSDRESGRR